MRPDRRLSSRPWAAVPLVFLLAGCQTNPTIKDAIDKTLSAAAAAATAAPVAQAAPTSAGGAQAANLFQRDMSGMAALFNKGTVNGVELLGELKAVRRVMAGGGGLSMQQLLSETSGVGAGSAGNFSGAMVKEMAVQVALAKLESELKRFAMSMALKELQGHLDFLIGDSQALSAQTISLPSARGLTQPQMQRALTMAAIVVATRVSTRMVRQAQQDLASLETEYKELIERRERAATLLLQAIGGALPAGARGSFSEADLAYLRALSARVGVGEFAKDMGAQNMALRLVSATDPAAFADFKARSEGLTRRQAAGLRTVGGVVAFGALLTVFGNEVAKMGREQPLPELLTMGPLLFAFATESAGFVRTSWDLLNEGTNAVVKSNRSFRVTVGERTEEVSNAAAVFDILAKNGALPELQRALFRDDRRGLLNSVSNCDREAAATMLDMAVPRELRAGLARERGLADPDRFAFVNAVADEPGGKLVDVLLGNDMRPRLQAEPVLGRVQQRIAGQDGSEPAGYLKWNTDQLLRLVFVNRDGSAAQFAAMEISGVTVRPVPSMQSLYAYEKLATACGRLFAPPAATPAPTPARTSTPARASPPASTNPPRTPSRPPAQRPSSPPPVNRP